MWMLGSKYLTRDASEPFNFLISYPVKNSVDKVGLNREEEERSNWPLTVYSKECFTVIHLLKNLKVFCLY